MAKNEKIGKKLWHEWICYGKNNKKLWHKFKDYSIHRINHKELIKMVKDEKQKTTIHINPEVWELARMKAKCSGSRLIEELLIDFIGNDSNIIEYEEKIKQSEEIILKEKTKIKQYKKAIEVLEEQMIENGKNEKLLGECLERIRQYNSRHKFISLQFLLRLSKVKNVPFDVLNDICINHGMTIKNVNDTKE